MRCHAPGAGGRQYYTSSLRDRADAYYCCQHRGWALGDMADPVRVPPYARPGAGTVPPLRQY